MRIITTSVEDFVNSEIDEWGFDYVEAQFIAGYEPMLVNGVYCWERTIDNGVPANNTSTGGFSIKPNKLEKSIVKFIKSS